MDIPILLGVLCYLLLLTKASSCSPAKCSTTHPSPEIRFPFKIEALQPPECGLPHFNLFCKHNTTMIHLPSYGDLSVKSISYDGETRLNLVDPRNCVHQVFLNLNLSLTPFTYYYRLQRYKYINCSTKLDAHFFQRLPCLSDSSHHVYILRPSVPTPVSCTPVATVEIPFAYSPYISDSSFGLSLTWTGTPLQQEASLGILCGLNKYLRAVFAAMAIIACAFIVGKLLYASLSNYHQEFNQHKWTETFEDEHIHKLLQEYDDQII